MDTIPHKRVGMFSVSGYDIISSPFVNTVKYLSNVGYVIDIFGASLERMPEPNFNNNTVSYFAINSRNMRFGFLERILRIIKIWKHVKKNKYDFLIGFDPDGLFDAFIISLLKRAIFIYHNLEIYSLVPKVKLKMKLKKNIEVFINKFALLTITQDESRANILRDSNKIKKEKIAVVYNSSFGNPVKTKKNWFREKFNISSNKKIVLCVGSLIKEHLVEEVVCSSENWTDEFVLVLHGWFPDPILKDTVFKFSSQRPNKIYISTELLSIEKKLLIFQSVDIGLVLFNAMNENLTFVGGAAGKLFDFMQCGVPIVANDLPGMKELVEKNGIGAIVNKFVDLNNCLNKIVIDYQKYSNKCLSTFSKYSFEKSYQKVLDRILDKA